MFTRHDVWGLSEPDPWHPVLAWYARAVRLMRSRDGLDFADPRSWRHLAETHGTSIGRDSWPAGARWNECEHGSWFFLPWHRLYLHHFERTVRAAVVELGGPSDWALPYWNYGDSARPDARKLPPAFRASEMPGEPDNPLFAAERDQQLNNGTDMDTWATDASAALAETIFAGDVTTPSFGGAEGDRAHTGGDPGILEIVPHGAVHMQIGGTGGWMSRFETAARDPIFWLHHANLDRLWEVWLHQGGRTNPESSRWLHQWFEFGSGTWVTRLRVRDALDTEAEPLGYRYEELPAELVAAGSFREAVGRRTMAEGVPPELIGASRASVALGYDATSAEVDVQRPQGPLAAEAGDGPSRIFLKIENVTGSRLAAGSYAVHLTSPGFALDGGEEGGTPAGIISLFGVRESSRADEEHTRSGVSFTLDITDAANELMGPGMEGLDRIGVRFTPLAAAARDEPEPDVQVGGIKIFAA